MGIELPRNNPSEGGRRSVTANATPISVIPSSASTSASAAAASRAAAASHARSVSRNAAHDAYPSERRYAPSSAPSNAASADAAEDASAATWSDTQCPGSARRSCGATVAQAAPWSSAAVSSIVCTRLDVTRGFIWTTTSGRKNSLTSGDTSIRSAQSTTCGHPADAGDQDEDAVDEDAVDEDAVDEDAVDEDAVDEVGTKTPWIPVALPAARPRTRTPDAASATTAHLQRLGDIRGGERVRRVTPARDDENPTPRGSNQRGEFAEDAVARGRSVAVDERASRVAVESRDAAFDVPARDARRDGALPPLEPAQLRGSHRRDRAEWISELTVDDAPVPVGLRGGGATRRRRRWRTRARARRRPGAGDPPRTSQTRRRFWSGRWFGWHPCRGVPAVDLR